MPLSATENELLSGLSAICPPLTGDVTGSTELVRNACTVFGTMHDRDEPTDGWMILGSPEAPVDIQDVLPSTLPGRARLHPVNRAIRIVTLTVLVAALAGGALWGLQPLAGRAAAASAAGHESPANAGCKAERSGAAGRTPSVAATAAGADLPGYLYSGTSFAACLRGRLAADGRRMYAGHAAG